MASVQARAATLEDLARVTDKAELIDGRIELLMPTGRKPARVAGRIYRSLDDYATQSGRGEAYPDNVGFAVPRLLPAASRLLLMHRTTLGRFRRTRCDSCKAHPPSPSRSEAKTTTLLPPKQRLRPNEPIISGGHADRLRCRSDRRVYSHLPCRLARSTSHGQARTDR